MLKWMESTMSLQFCDLQWCACNLVSLKLSKTQHVTWTSSIWIFEGLEKKPKYNLLTNKCFVFNIYSHFIHDIQSLYIYIYTNTYAPYPLIYCLILRQYFEIFIMKTWEQLAAFYLTMPMIAFSFVRKPVFMLR